MSQTEVNRENRQKIVEQLKLTANRVVRGDHIGEEISEQLLSGLLREAAFHIEDGEKYRIEPTERYRKAIEQYRKLLQAALDVANDPYKAPELTVETTRTIMEAAWNLNVEYAAMMQGHGGNA